MFLLFLIGLGTASLKAQVRIGGNGTPNAAAVLDLNADDANAGTKGLALPRVSLTNASTPLTGTPVVNGMMIYNTNASTTGGSGVGIYYWDGSTSKWVKVINSDFTVPLSKIQTSLADSGLILKSDGQNIIASTSLWNPYTVIPNPTKGWTSEPKPVTWSVILDTLLTLEIHPGYATAIVISYVSWHDVCTSSDPWIILRPANGDIVVFPMFMFAQTRSSRVRCYHPSV